jgi:hypothetical protein
MGIVISSFSTANVCTHAMDDCFKELMGVNFLVEFTIEEDIRDIARAYQALLVVLSKPGIDDVTYGYIKEGFI